jgi:hypothetical protein
MILAPIAGVVTHDSIAIPQFPLPESLEGCACLSVNSMDHYTTRQDVTEKTLLEVPEAQSHNSDICDSKTETLQL